MNYTKAIILSTGEIVTPVKTCNTLKTEARGVLFDILEDRHRHFFEDELHVIEDLWGFIEKHLPGYYHDERVAQSDDLQCCLDAEADDEKLKRVCYLFGDTPEEWERAQLKIDRELLEEAVEHFMSAASDSDRS